MMFQKVLITEDMDDINKGVYATLCEIGVSEIDKAQYCDDAYLKVKRAVFDKKPYDLIISDLSFESDYKEQKLQSGEDLVAVLKKEYPNLKVIIYSVEDRLQRVKRLLTVHHVDAYVCKGRFGLQDLTKAIHHIINNETPYLSEKVQKAIRTKEDTDITDYDINIMKLLSKGFCQKEISAYFTEHSIKPSGLSSVEKRISRLKDLLKAKNLMQLIAVAKDQGFV